MTHRSAGRWAGLVAPALLALALPGSRRGLRPAPAARRPGGGGAPRPSGGGRSLRHAPRHRGKPRRARDGADGRIAGGHRPARRAGRTQSRHRPRPGQPRRALHARGRARGGGPASCARRRAGPPASPAISPTRSSRRSPPTPGLAALATASPPPAARRASPAGRGRPRAGRGANTAWNTAIERLEPRFRFPDAPEADVLPPTPKVAAWDILREHARVAAPPATTAISTTTATAPIPRSRPRGIRRSPRSPIPTRQGQRTWTTG